MHPDQHRGEVSPASSAPCGSSADTPVVDYDPSLTPEDGRQIEEIQQSMTGLTLLARALAERLADEHLESVALATHLADELTRVLRHVGALARHRLPVDRSPADDYCASSP